MGLHIRLPERSRRAFWARLYARRRLISGLAAPFAPAHYAQIGERLGYRPNAFFDPNAFRAHVGVGKGANGGLLELYLARPEPNAPSPSAEFDHAWYVSQNPDWAQSHPHPFLHFIERGLRAGRRPRADIDVAFVRDITRGVKPRSLEEATFRVFDRTLAKGEIGAAPQPAGIAGASGPFLCRWATAHRTRSASPGAQRPRLRPVRQGL